jgi:hypothetical protein
LILVLSELRITSGLTVIIVVAEAVQRVKLKERTEIVAGLA